MVRFPNAFLFTSLSSGVVPLLYGILLHTQVFSRGHSTAVIPPEVAKHALSVAEISMSLLNHVALLDLSMLQATLGSEGLSLQLRHISSYLLWYCSHWKGNQRLVHEVILLLGFFALNHPDNQVSNQEEREREFAFLPDSLSQPFFLLSASSVYFYLSERESGRRAETNGCCLFSR